MKWFIIENIAFLLFLVGWSYSWSQWTSEQLGLKGNIYAGLLFGLIAGICFQLTCRSIERRFFPKDRE